MERIGGCQNGRAIAEIPSTTGRQAGHPRVAAAADPGRARRCCRGSERTRQTSDRQFTEYCDGLKSLGRIKLNGRKGRQVLGVLVELVGMGRADGLASSGEASGPGLLVAAVMPEWHRKRPATTPGMVVEQQRDARGHGPVLSSQLWRSNAGSMHAIDSDDAQR